MAASGTGTVASSVLSVVLNLLSEKEMVLGMRVSGQPMRLSAVFMQLKENSLLKVRDSHCS
jgi:1-aminocyclopropane-1-carboxylate deaminase/D-cysteine desulfhydrase-like pyridoxal-dependent ACC family enzyme